MFLLGERRKKRRDCDSSCSPAWVGEGGCPTMGRGQRAEPQVPERRRQPMDGPARTARGPGSRGRLAERGPRRWGGFSTGLKPAWPRHVKTRLHPHTPYTHHTETHTADTPCVHIHPTHYTPHTRSCADTNTQRRTPARAYTCTDTHIYKHTHLQSPMHRHTHPNVHVLPHTHTCLQLL